MVAGLVKQSLLVASYSQQGNHYSYAHNLLLCLVITFTNQDILITHHCLSNIEFFVIYRHIVFTVGPRYNPKYQTAAENALHSSYRSCMQVARENNISSIAFCTIHSEARGYPPENGAHVGISMCHTHYASNDVFIVNTHLLGTIRRFLEKHGQSIHDVILCLERMVCLLSFRLQHHAYTIKASSWVTASL